VPEFGPTGGQPTGPVDTGTHEGRNAKIAGLVVTGVGVVLFGVGIKYAADGAAHTDFENNYKTTHPGQPWPGDIQAYEAEGRSDNTKQAIFMIAGGAAIATGVIVYFVGRSKAASSEHASLHPTATPTSVGLALTGAF
jgi:hypothetical protein